MEEDKVQDDDVEKEKGHDVEDDDVEGDDEKDDNVPEDEVEEDNAAEDEVEDNDVKGDAPQNLGAHFVHACAVETHVEISQEPLYAEIYRKTPGAQSEHPDQAPAFTPTVRTPQCEHTVWGKTETVGN